MSKTFNQVALGLSALLVFLSPQPLANTAASRQYWIVWNVGQGQWSTLVDEKNCLHFDMGGEKNPIHRVLQLCQKRKNRLFFSHWDWDHLGFAKKAQRAFPQACLELAPRGISTPRKMKILKSYPPCSTTELKEPSTKFHWRELTRQVSFSSQRPRRHPSSNELSHVLVLGERILLPGDSPLQQEKLWVQQKGLARVKYLLLGHHGSRTSTSDELLWALPRLQMAVASARSARFGHPHSEVLRRLQKFHIPLLKTEDWGHIWIELPLP